MFPRRRVAVYVDGCFWHWCPSHRTIPKANRDWWVTKLEANEARDRATDVQLEEEGWTVLRFWEHEDPVAVADAIEATVRGRGQEERERETTPM